MPDYLPDLIQPIPSTGIIVGVSGGLDSMVLLQVLANSTHSLVAAHINYGLRNADSDADEALVQSVCEKLGVKFEVYKAVPESLSEGNLQNNARNLRYNFFNELRNHYGAKWISTAHHRDDQVETAMLRLFRAGSAKSLTGMRVVDEVNHVYRPLLPFTREQLKEYAISYGIDWREDASNAESYYARNLLRNQLFPKMDDLLPGWRTNLENLMGRMQVADELGGLYIKQILTEDGQGISVSGLLSTPPATRLALLHTFVKDHAPETTAGQLTQLSNLLESQPGKKIQLNSTTTVWRNQQHLQIDKNAAAQQTKPRNPSIKPLANQSSPPENSKPSPDNQTSPLANPPETIPKTFNQPSGHVHTHWANIRLRPRPAPTQSELRNPSTLWLNASKVILPITFRKWQPSDFIQPLGMQGSVLISDLLNSRRIASHQKNEAIVATAFDGNICAVIFPHPSGTGFAGCINERFKINTNSPDAIEISIEYIL